MNPIRNPTMSPIRNPIRNCIRNRIRNPIRNPNGLVPQIPQQHTKKFEMRHEEEEAVATKIFFPKPTTRDALALPGI